MYPPSYHHNGIIAARELGTRCTVTHCRIAWSNHQNKGIILIKIQSLIFLCQRLITIPGTVNYSLLFSLTEIITKLISLLGSS